MSILHQIETAIPALRRYARALLRDRDMADDLVQDTLERAVARRHSWRGDGPIEAWLFRIMLNRHRDSHRRNHLQLVPQDEIGHDPAVPANQETRLDLAQVQAAIATLPGDQRQALLLVALEGFSIAQAARTLGVPPGTVMSRIGRARHALREKTGRTTPDIAPPKEERP